MWNPATDTTHVEQCASTQLLARAWVVAAAAGAVHAFTTDHQHAGAGRQGRSWSDRPGSAVLASVAAAGPFPTDVLEGLTLRLAERLAHLLRTTWDAPVDVSPPNDLVVGDAKLAGLLVDSATVGDRVTWLVAGVGLNVHAPAPHLPDRPTIALDELAPHARLDDVRMRVVCELAAALDCR